jgi:hypothetical protein
MQVTYRTSKTMGLGFGLDQQTYLLSFNYNLEPGPLSSYTRGAFELGMKLRLFTKRKI